MFDFFNSLPFSTASIPALFALYLLFKLVYSALALVLGACGVLLARWLEHR